MNTQLQEAQKLILPEMHMTKTELLTKSNTCLSMYKANIEKRKKLERERLPFLNLFEWTPNQATTDISLLYLDNIQAVQSACFENKRQALALVLEIQDALDNSGQSSFDEYLDFELIQHDLISIV
jgi:hypothetical protein